MIGNCQPENIGNIAEKHIGALDGGEGLVKSLGNGLFNKALLQADAKFAGGDFDEIFGFKGCQALQSVLEQGLLRSRTAPQR